MASPTQKWSLQKPTIMLFILCISFPSSLEEGITSSNKLDQPVVVDQPEDPEIKCGSCPCGDTCGDPPPPPPSPSPPPPPPPLPCPSPPPPPPSPPPPPPPSPPPPKYPSCPQNCNPLSPPPPRIIYVPGQPKPSWIYYYSAAENRGVGILLVLALGGLSVAMVLG